MWQVFQWPSYSLGIIIFCKTGVNIFGNARFPEDMQLKQRKCATSVKTGVTNPVTCLPYSHEHLPQWGRACAQSV